MAVVFAGVVGLAFGCTVTLPADPGPDAGPGPDGGSGPDCRYDRVDCAAGQVCNLVTGQCGPGRSCDPEDPEACRPCAQGTGCGHGLALVSRCDPEHGVCVRSRSACEPCQSDGDCGPAPVGGTLRPSHCVEDGSSAYCAPPCETDADCPLEFGFRCRRLDGGPLRRACMRLERCESLRLELCPLDGVSGAQAVYETPCPGGGYCATNLRPGMLGLCLGRCLRDADCPDPGTICNRMRGVCQVPCLPNQCASASDPPQVCHEDGLCGRPCDRAEDPDAWCRDRFDSPGVHCNLAATRPPPFERDSRLEVGACLQSCAPGVCPPGQTCVSDDRPARCIDGCRSPGDCFPGDRCVAADPGVELSVEECATRDPLGAGDGLGACCAAGAP